MEGGDSRQYVHLKYDFVPGRTNLDAPATLRQRPLTGADGKANRDGQRWAAEVEYESRDSENPRPVLFRGDASRYVESERERGACCVFLVETVAFVAQSHGCCCCCANCDSSMSILCNYHVILCYKLWHAMLCHVMPCPTM